MQAEAQALSVSAVQRHSYHCIPSSGRRQHAEPSYGSSSRLSYIKNRAHYPAASKIRNIGGRDEYHLTTSRLRHATGNDDFRKGLRRSLSEGALGAEREAAEWETKRAASSCKAAAGLEAELEVEREASEV